MVVIKLLFKESQVIMKDNNIEEIISLTNDLEDLKDCLKKLLETKHKAIIMEGECQSSFSNTVYLVDGKLVDVRLALMDEIGLPVLTQAEVDKVGLDDAIREFYSYHTWHLDYHGIGAGKKECSKESLLTIGNGFFGLRGAFAEAKASDDHYPATYIAGLFNQLATPIGEHEVVNEDFVNAPNAQFITFRVNDEPWFSPEAANILDCYRSLNLKNGELTIQLLASIGDGKEVLVRTKKVANMKDRHQYALSYEITPINFSGEIEICSQIDGSIINSGVERYRSLASKHLVVKEAAIYKDVAYLGAVTTQSNIELGIVAKLSIPQDMAIENEVEDEIVTQKVTFRAESGVSYLFEKQVAIFTSNETTGNLVQKATEAATKNSYMIAKAESTSSWKDLWQQIDIKVTGDWYSQKLLRLHNFHLMVSASPFANYDLDASIGARGLHGEAYRGHIFWDEIYILPYYILHFPETAKQILLYRYKRLPAAKIYAKEHGYEGAMFPWQSGLYGDEQSQVLHLNPLSGQWGKDYSSLQRHVSLAVVYNVWYYYHITQDQEFLAKYGMEILLEVAKFWLSKATENPETKRYDIHKVMGPNEFHDKYPGAEEGGFTNNAYTNMTVVWFLEALERLKLELPSDKLKGLMEKTGFTDDDWQRADDIMHRLTLDIDENGIIGQYQGFFELKEFDWDHYREKYGNIYRLDRLLKAEGKSANDYKVTKQADALMAFYNFDKNQIDEILQDLNYQLPEDYLEKNLHYYLARTSHGSTLSRIVHAPLAEEIGNRQLAWKLFSEALNSDYGDIQGGTTAEGIHTGVMAATLMVTLSTFGGVNVRGDMLTLNPNLPEKWERLAFNLCFKGINLQVTMTKDDVRLLADADISVSIKGRMYHLVKNTCLLGAV